MPQPEFVVIGHVVRDLLPGGWRLGGTPTFAALQARLLGLRAGVVTRAAADIDLQAELPGVELACSCSDVTTSFQNVYTDGRRSQFVRARADALDVADIPAGWRGAAITLLGPVCGELPPELGLALRGGLVGASAQGWLREVGPAGAVRRIVWSGPAFWQGCDVLFVSDEDLDGHVEQVDRWSKDVPLVVVTRDRLGARVREREGWRAMEAFPATEVDPTGAGDVFAAAFLVRYHETKDTAEGACFAGAAAAFSVEGAGSERIATRSEIEARMREHPEIALR